MAIKTFTSGEVLTAADTNTYLANSGLVYIGGGTLAPAGTIAVNGCFTSAYTNYRILLWQTVLSAAGDVFFNMRASGTSSVTNYYWNRMTSNGGIFGAVATNTTSMYGFYTVATTLNSATIEVFEPQVAMQTKINISGQGYNGANSDSRTTMGFHDLANSYDGFSLTSSVATVGTKYAIYGYRIA